MTYKRKEVIGNATLYLGDCLEILPTLDKVDAVITDPPYGIGFRYLSYKDTEDSFKEYILALKGMPIGLLQYPEEMMRLVVPIIGAPDQVLAWVYNSNLPRQFRLWGFWQCDIDPARSKQSAKNPEDKKVKELMVNGYDWKEIPQVKNISSEKTEHPCQLPSAVANWIIECVYAPLIMDPFMGSGTIGVACMNLGRKFIGIEIEEKYFNIACERISQAQKQLKMFE